jgi:hypothetical protein
MNHELCVIKFESTTAFAQAGVGMVDKQSSTHALRLYTEAFRPLILFFTTPLRGCNQTFRH